MMIGKVLALTIGNLKRQWSYMGRMTDKGVPREMIHFIRGKRAKDFENDYSLISEAAAADGFKFVRFFQGHGDTGIIRQTPAQMAQVWEFARILRYIANQDEMCLLTWDDRTLTVPFRMLNVIVNEHIHGKDGYGENYYLFQLRLRGHQHYLQLPEEPAWETHEVHTDLFKGFTNLNHELNYGKVFTRLGMHGYDETIVFSPAGAAWMLDEMHKIQDIDPEIKKLSYADISLSQKPHYSKVINIDNWICWGLKEAAEKAVKAWKGIYRPRYRGFDFITDALPLGSETGWASEQSVFFDEANSEMKLQYLEVS